MSEGFADKESFFGGFKRRWLEVETPLGKMTLGSLSEREMSQLEKDISRLYKKKNEDLVRLTYIKWGCWKSDKSGRMFTDEDIQRMASEDIDYAVTRALSNAIVDHIGTSNEDIQALAKN